MNFFRTIPIPKDGVMKTYIFKAVIEPDDDRWAAYCPALLKQGVIIRPMGGNRLRVTIGLPEENKRFVSELEKVVTA